MNEIESEINNQPTKETHPAEKEKELFSKNVVVLATHGSYYVPFAKIPKEDVSRFPEEDIRMRKDEDGEDCYYLNIRKKLSPEMKSGIKTENPERKEYLLRLLKNFSDSMTRKMLKGIPEDQKVSAWFSRAIGDPARGKEDKFKDLFPKFDFTKNDLENPVWKEELTQEEKEWLFENFNKKYHEKVEETIKLAEQKTSAQGGKVIIFDIHDTGKEMLNVDPKKDYEREGGFPDINLGNMDGQSCDPEIFDNFTEILKKYWKEYFQNEPDLKINTPYKGTKARTMHEHAIGPRQNTQDSQRNFIQIELGRSLYMDEKTQKPDHEKIKIIREILQKAMGEIGRKYESAN